MYDLRIAMCEDIESDAEYLHTAIEELQVAAEITRFESGEDFLAAGAAGRYDIVFFDIYMREGGLSGMDTARKFREADSDCAIVFATTSEDYKHLAWDVDAQQYLVKPIEREKLERVFTKRLAYPHRVSAFCPVNVKGQTVNILHDHICFVEVYSHKCLVHTVNGVTEASTTMKIDDFEKLLPPPRFMRCHQSYLVNLSHVEKVERDFIMKDGKAVYIRGADLPKCKKYKQELNKWKLLEAGRVEF